MTDQGSTQARKIVENMLGADAREQIAQRGREFAASVGDATQIVSQRAMDAWHDTAHARHEAAEAATEAGREAVAWGRDTWRQQLRPGLSRLWNKRTAVLAAAGMAIPAGKEVAQQAAAQLSGSRREASRWGAFFLGLLAGAAAGIAAALLMAPKAGRQVREDLAVVARDAAIKAREAAEKARELAAANAPDWVPIFQRELEAEPEAEPLVPKLSETAIAEPAPPMESIASSKPISSPVTPRRRTTPRSSAAKRPASKPATGASNGEEPSPTD